MNLRYIHLFYLLLFIVLSNCSTKQTFTKLSKNLRQIDIISYEDKEVVKTYYQGFNERIYEWVDVTCDFIQTRFGLRRIDNCTLTKLSKSLIKNKESKTDSEVAKRSELNQEKSELTQENYSSNENENLEQNQSNTPGQLPNEIQGQDFEECNDPQKC